MASRSPFWSSVRDLFGGSSSRRRCSRGKRPGQSFLAQFDGRDGAVGRQAPAPFGGFDALEVRVMLAVTTAAESEFGFDTATGTITSYTGAGGDIVIPATIGGVTVTGIGNNAFKNNATLTSLSLPTGLTTIGNSAFEGCTGLTSLSLPNSVTSIGTFAFKGCSGLTSLTIPDGVTSISQNAFYLCSGLTSLTIPDGVTRIGFNSFAGCIGLTSLTIPNSVTIIDNRAFQDCHGLTSLYFLGNAPTAIGIYTFDRVPATISYLTGTTGWTSPFLGLTAVGVAAVDYRSGDFAYSISKDSATITEYTGSGGAVTIPDTIFGLPVNGIGDDAFYNKATLTSLVIPATVTTIGDGAFQDCTGLTSLPLPTNLTSIGNGAFAGCTGLTSLSLPTNLTTIGDSAFAGCTGLTSLSLPTNLTSIGSRAFSYCTGLTSLTIPDGVTSIGSNAFSGCTGLTSLTIPDGVTSISNAAFFGCTGLTSLSLPTNLKTISGMTFYGCTGLTSLTLPNSVTSIGNNAFQDCTGLTSLSLPTNLTTIGGQAFRGCTGLTSLTLPNSVTSIGSAAFYGCTGLTSLYFLGNAPDAAGAFSGVSATIYYLTGTTGWTNPFNGLTAVAVDYTTGDFKWSIASGGVTITAYTGSGGAVTIPDTIFGLPVTGIGNYAFYNKATLTSLVIPATVTTIGDDAFEECVNLTTIALPASLTRIGDYAFWNCASLTSLSFPSGLATIGEQAFYNCAGLTTLAIPASVASIGNLAFEACAGLTAFDVAAGNAHYKSIDGLLFTKDGSTLVQCPQAKTGSVSLPAGLTTIGANALANCAGLTGVAIPAGVTAIGAGALYGCYGLTSLAIPASVTSIGVQAFTGCNALTALTVEAGNPAFKNVGSLLLTANGQTVVACPAGTTGAIAIPAGVTTIGDYAFKGCGGLTGVTILAGVTTIGAGAFSSCNGLTSLMIPATVTFLGPNAFERCTGLASLVFLGNAPGGGAFPFDRVTATITYLSGTTGWTNPFNGLTAVGVDAVDYRSGDFAYSISKDGATITEYTGAGGAVTFPATVLGLPVTAIGIDPFDFMPAARELITSVTIPATVTSIGDYAFTSLSGLTNLTIPAAVTSIGSRALARCSGLTAFTVEPENTSFKTVGSLLLTADGKTLVACAGGAVGAIVVPAGDLTTIAAGAFDGCSRLTSLTIPVGVTNIGNDAFQGCTSLTSFALPASVASIGASAFIGCRQLTTITVEAGNTSYKTANGLLLTADGKTVILCPPGATGAVAIPAGVTSIGDHAFFNVTGLTSLALPAGLTSIGARAFRGCSGLTSLAIPHSVTTIGAYAFNSCSGLTTLTIPAAVTSIGEEAFSYTGSLKSLYFLGDAPTTVGARPFATYSSFTPPTLYYLTGTTGWTNPFFDAPTVAVDFTTGDFRWSIASGAVTITGYTGSAAAVTIPDTIFGLPVTGIGDSAIAGNTGLTSIVIHAGITSIGTNAFKGCTGLTSLSFLGNAPATVGGDAFSGVTATIYYLPATTGWSSSFSGLTAIAINAAPTAVSLSPTSASVAENTSTAARLKMADIVVTDDGVGTNATTLSGVDAASFEVDAGVLYLKAGTVLDFETKTSYSVTVNVADSSVAGSIPVTAEFTLTVTNVNEAPTAVSLSPASASVAENTSTATRLKMADIAITDDDLGTNATTLTGADAAHFEVDAGVLYLKAGTLIDFETKTSYSVTVSVADSSVAASIPVTAEFTLTVTDVVEDFTKPVLVGVAAPAARTYPSSAKLLFTATFSEPVTVTGPAGISFTGISGGSAGKAAKIATYESGSGTNQIIFSYLIAAGEAAKKGLVVAGSIQLPAGASVADLAGNTPAALTFTPPAAGSVKVDGSVPVLTKTTGPAAKTFKAGEVLSFSVTWNENVFVVGAPRILIAVGGSPREAVYASGSGSKTVKFNYVAAAGDNGGVSLGSGAIALSGGTIRDSIGNPAGLVLKAVNLSKVAVDTARPAVVSVALPLAGSYAKGKTATIGVTFGETLKVTGKPTLAVTVAPGVTRTFVFSKATGGTAFFTYKFAAAETVAGFTLPGAISLAGNAAIRDAVGNTAILSLPAPV